MRLRGTNWGLLILWLLTVPANADTVQVRKFTVPQAARQGLMGFAVSLRGDLGFAGAPAGTRAPGKGYLFDVNTGQLLRTIVPSVPRSDDLFGFNARLSATRLLVGDPGNPYAAVRVPGAAYVFDPASGVETRRLLANDGFAGDEFGFGVNLSDDLAIIGAPAYKTGPGAAYLFDLSSGQQLRKLVPQDPLQGSDFGVDVAVSPTFAVVGAPVNYDELGLVPGSAYLFDVATGSQLAKLQAADGFGGDEFGFDVAVSGDLAVIGAPNGGVDLGAAYVFDLSTGRQLAKLVPGDGRRGNNFGGSVDIQGQTVLIGASGLDNPGVLGAAYVFDARSGRQLAKLSPTDVQERDAFGESVALWGQHALVGAPQDDDTNLDAGAAYLFELNFSGDFNRDGQLDVVDIDLLTAASAALTHDTQFDLNADQRVNIDDVQIWIKELKHGWVGDADVDGAFDSNDFVQVFARGKYELAEAAVWSEGDWNGDGRFASEDFVAAFADGGYEQGPRAAAQAAAVPEPHGLGLLVLGGCGLLWPRRTAAAGRGGPATVPGY